MSNFQELLDTADATKLHAEVNQLRNQEFLICSYALLLLGASFPVTDQEPEGVIALLIGFAALFYWYYTLCSIRTRLTVYLDLSQLSNWEDHWRKFADIVTNPSQRTAATVLFVLFGIIGTALPAWKLFGATAPTILYWMIGVLVAYVLFISFFGFKDYRIQRAYYEKEWKRVLNQNGSKLRTPSQVPHAPTEEA